MKDKIQVLERAFHVLEQIAQEGARPHTVGELAEKSGLKVQTLSKIVRTLTLLGYLENTGRKNGYILGEKLLRLAESYRDPDMLRRLVRPYLKTYAEQIGEYICFSVLRGYYKRIVCKIRAKKPIPDCSTRSRRRRMRLNRFPGSLWFPGPRAPARSNFTTATGRRLSGGNSPAKSIFRKWNRLRERNSASPGSFVPAM